MSEYIYDAELIRVIDGDTVVFRLKREVEIPFGFRFTAKMNVSFEAAFRMAGINAPELHTKSASEKKKAVAAREKLEYLLLTASAIRVQSQKPEGPLESDKYGRWLALVKITTPEQKELDVAAELIAAGLVLPYDGKGARPTFDD